MTASAGTSLNVGIKVSENFMITIYKKTDFLSSFFDYSPLKSDAVACRV
jgi:hypothetical protein